MDPITNHEAAFLHELRLRGRLEGPDPRAAALCRRGFAKQTGLTLTLTAEGRAAHAAWARLAPGSTSETTTRRAYQQFLPLNAELLKISTDWQVLNGGIPNDHTDLTYDWSVKDRLTALNARAAPLVHRLSDQIEQFAAYETRLDHALRNVQAGEHEYFLSPRCDSYHTVWTQLHEDLLLALGLDRLEETATIDRTLS